MAKLKFSIHPLFIIFGIYFAACGKVFSFLIFTLSAVIHEMGHSICASSHGYQLKRLVLMPYGAVIRGDTKDMNYYDETLIALSGPFVSLFVGVALVSLWWLVPDLYPYTEVCVLANLTIATVNLLPAYPLDGGRVLLAVLSCYLPRKKSLKISRIIGITAAVCVFGLFIYSISIKQINYSVLFFSLFMLFGNIFVSKDNRYERITSYFSLGNLKRGKRINALAVDISFTVRDLQQKYKYGELTECIVFDDYGRKVANVSPEMVVKILSLGKLNNTVYEEYKKAR